MSEAFQTTGSWGVTVFCVTSLLNVGLTQEPSRLREHLGNGAFLVRMLVIDLVVVPGLVIAATDVVPLQPVHAAGLLILSLAAGAPFLIELADTSDADIARVVITLVNTLGVVLLIAAAKVMSSDNGCSVLIPTAIADPPHRRRER